MKIQLLPLALALALIAGWLNGYASKVDKVTPRFYRNEIIGTVRLTGNWESVRNSTIKGNLIIDPKAVRSWIHDNTFNGCAYSGDEKRMTLIPKRKLEGE